MNSFTTYILQDWEVNKGTSFKSRLVLFLFRTAQLSTKLPFPFSVFSIFFRGLYQLTAEWILGVELPWDVEVGSNLKIQHGLALVVNHGTTIGENCTLRQSTTIGNKRLPDGSYSNCPKIGSNVEIGANVVIIGDITIGDNAVIGAGSVVVKDVPEGAVVAGNPAKVIRTVNVTSYAVGRIIDTIDTVEMMSASSHSKG